MDNANSTQCVIHDHAVIHCDCGGTIAATSVIIFISILLAVFVFIIFQVLFFKYRSKLESCWRRAESSSVRGRKEAESGQEGASEVAESDSQEKAAEKEAPRVATRVKTMIEKGGPPLAPVKFKKNTAYTQHKVIEEGGPPLPPVKSKKNTALTQLKVIEEGGPPLLPVKFKKNTAYTQHEV